MKNLVLIVVVLVCCSPSFAVDPSTASANNPFETALSAQKNVAEATPSGPLSPAACAFTFTSGAGDTFLKYCVTANGNITVFETPAGHEHIAIGTIGEGYGICDLGNLKHVEYFDYAESGDSGNWGPATVMSQNAKSVKIARSTSDGIWTLTQTFTQVAGTAPSVKVDMALTNHSLESREAFIVRYVDADADGSEINDGYATTNSAFAWNRRDPKSRTGFGVQLQGAPFTPDPRSGPMAFAQFIGNGFSTCEPTAGAYQEPARLDQVAMGVFYDIAVPKGRTKTVTVSYKGL